MFLALISCCNVVNAALAYILSKSLAIEETQGLAINILFALFIIDVNFFLLGVVADVTNQPASALFGGLILAVLSTSLARLAGRGIRRNKS